MSTNGNLSASAQEYVEKYQKVKTLLISQPKPVDKSPYYDLEEKYGLTIDWRPFIHVEAVTEKEFRKNRINLGEFNCVIFSSKGAIDNYFRLCEETRVKVSQETRYFVLQRP